MEAATRSGNNLRRIGSLVRSLTFFVPTRLAFGQSRFLFAQRSWSPLSLLASDQALFMGN